MSTNLSRAPIGTRFTIPTVDPPLPLPLPQSSKHGQSYARRRSDILALLLLGIPLKEIQTRVGVAYMTVLRVHQNLMKYGSVRPPRFRTLGRRPKLTPADKIALLTELCEHGWMDQEEMVFWLHMERDIRVHQSTVSRMLTKEGWNKKNLRVISLNRCEDLRDNYRNTIAQYNADDLVFIDESLFNERTGWRHRAYGPIGHENRWIGDAKRGRAWSILPAYTLHHGYLDCTGVKEGYYDTEGIVDWLQNHLLPTIDREMGGRAVCIVMDNCSTHCNEVIREVIQRAGHGVQYLPPYSPDYNPIELTFSVLKAWVRRHYYYRRHQFDSFGDFLRWGIIESRCDRFSVGHFRHAGGGGLYISREALEEAQRTLRAYEDGEIELLPM